MTQSDRPRPGITPQAEAERDARVQREAAALRVNLRRRKEQLRSRNELEGSKHMTEPNKAERYTKDEQ